MSKTRLLCHIVFATRKRQPTITEKYKRDLYAYIYGILNNRKCFVHRINGCPDHIHLLIDLHPAVALSDIVKEVKLASSSWLRQSDHFPAFVGWGEGYYAFSVGSEELESVRHYIINQEAHHKTEGLVEEMEEWARLKSIRWWKDDLG